MLISICPELVIPPCDLGSNSNESLLSCANGKALALDISVFVGVMHKNPESNKVIIRHEVITLVWIEQDCEAKLCVGAVYLVHREFFGFTSICPKFKSGNIIC